MMTLTTMMLFGLSTVNAASLELAPRLEGQSCGPCNSPPDYSCGSCAIGLECRCIGACADPRMADAPRTCVRPLARLTEAAKDGLEEYQAGMIAPGCESEVAACQLDSECDACVKTGGLWSLDGMDTCRANTACAAGLACRQAHTLGHQQCKTELAACFMDPECFPLLEDRYDCLTNDACSSYLACGATAEITKHHPECEAVAASCGREVECLRVMDVEDEYARCHLHELCLPVLGCAFPEKAEVACNETVAACAIDPECAAFYEGLLEGVYDEGSCRENQLCVLAMECMAIAPADTEFGVCVDELVACRNDDDCHTLTTTEYDAEACHENELCLSTKECMSRLAVERETGGLCGEETSACVLDHDCLALAHALDENPRSMELCLENEACHELHVCIWGSFLTEERPKCLPAVLECLQDAECIWIVYENTKIDDEWSGEECEKNALCAQAKSCAAGCAPLDRACLEDDECSQAMDDDDSCSRNELCLPMLECHWREAAQERHGDCGKEAAACVRDQDCHRQMDASGRPRGSILDCLENGACLAYTGCVLAVEITEESPECVDVAKACTLDGECAHIAHTTRDRNRGKDNTRADCQFPGDDALCSTGCEEDELCGEVVQCMLAASSKSDGMSETVVVIVVVLCAVVVLAGVYLACVCSMNQEPDVTLEKEPKIAHHQV